MSDNKKYYYLKVRETFFDSEEMKILESQKNGIQYQNLYLKLCLLSLKSGGALMFKDVFPYDFDMLSTVLRVSIDTIKTGVDIFTKLGLVEIIDGGIIFMSDLQTLIGRSSTEAERVNTYRARIKEKKGCTNVQEMYATCTPELELEIEKEKEKEIDTGRTFPPPSEGIEPQEIPALNASSRLEKARQRWNGHAGLPTYRYLPMSMPAEQRGEALRTLGAYTDEEVAEAIDAYATIFSSPKHKAFPTYVTFMGFMRGGIETYGPDANPFERCKIALKPGEYVDPDADEKAEKARRRAAEIEAEINRNKDEPDVQIDPSTIIGNLAGWIKDKSKLGGVDDGSNKPGHD
ncbi:MAG: phage replisome organizer N-terminal domain-containing protein [Spirochaetes bacterium]|nr:phage replisome organizer N-terminal domain-containing protein [Spirochaetota bacterium]